MKGLQYIFLFTCLFCLSHCTQNEQNNNKTNRAEEGQTSVENETVQISSVAFKDKIEGYLLGSLDKEDVAPGYTWIKIMLFNGEIITASVKNNGPNCDNAHNGFYTFTPIQLSIDKPYLLKVFYQEDETISSRYVDGLACSVFKFQLDKQFIEDLKTSGKYRQMESLDDLNGLSGNYPCLPLTQLVPKKKKYGAKNKELVFTEWKVQ